MNLIDFLTRFPEKQGPDIFIVKERLHAQEIYNCFQVRLMDLNVSFNKDVKNILRNKTKLTSTNLASTRSSQRLGGEKKSCCSRSWCASTINPEFIIE